jgi:hypothetical protein
MSFWDWSRIIFQQNETSPRRVLKVGQAMNSYFALSAAVFTATSLRPCGDRGDIRKQPNERGALSRLQTGTKKSRMGSDQNHVEWISRIVLKVMLGMLEMQTGWRGVVSLA